jgi:hypothetical protein
MSPSRPWAPIRPIAIEWQLSAVANSRYRSVSAGHISESDPPTSGPSRTSLTGQLRSFDRWLEIGVSLPAARAKTGLGVRPVVARTAF